MASHHLNVNILQEPVFFLLLYHIKFFHIHLPDMMYRVHFSTELKEDSDDVIRTRVPQSNVTLAVIDWRF